VKDAADTLYKRVGFSYNADDLANQVPLEFANYSLFLSI
jgi:hypothetical protein